MEASIRQALITGQTVPLNELTPKEWLVVINRLVDDLAPLARHMRFPLCIDDVVDSLEYVHGEKLSVTIYRSGKPCGGTFRFASLGMTSYSAWNYTEIAFGEDGELRVNQARWGTTLVNGDQVAVQPVFDSDVWSGERLIEILSASDKDLDGVNVLGRCIVNSLAKLIRANADRKVKQGQAFALASARVARTLSFLAD